jgi:hypothetical protein
VLLILYSQVYNGWRGFLSWEIITILGWHRMNRYDTWLGNRLCFLRGTVQPPIWQVGHYQLKLIVSGVIRVCSKPHFQWPVKGTCSSNLGSRTCLMTGDLILYISLLRQHLAAKMHISILDLSCQLFLAADGWYFLFLSIGPVSCLMVSKYDHGKSRCFWMISIQTNNLTKKRILSGSFFLYKWQKLLYFKFQA